MQCMRFPVRRRNPPHSGYAGALRAIDCPAAASQPGGRIQWPAHMPGLSISRRRRTRSPRDDAGAERAAAKKVTPQEPHADCPPEGARHVHIANPRIIDENAIGTQQQQPGPCPLAVLVQERQHQAQQGCRHQGRHQVCQQDQDGKEQCYVVTSIRPRGSEVAQAPGDPEASHYHRVERHQKQLVKWMVLARGLQSTKYIREPPRLFWGLPSAFTPQLDAPVPRPTLREGTGTVWISPGDANW
jgi:hypothetical protein